MKRIHARVMYIGTEAERAALSPSAEAVGLKFFVTNVVGGVQWMWNGAYWVSQVMGDGADKRIAYWTATYQLSGDADLTWDYSTKVLTVVGDVTVGDGTGGRFLRVDGAAGQSRQWQWSSGGSRRWDVSVNATAESGSNAGSDFEIVRRSDAGAIIDTAMMITRSGGAARFYQDLTVSADMYVDGTKLRLSAGVIEHNKANESVNGQATIRTRDMGVVNSTHNWMVEVIMTNFTIPANATTAFSFLDLDDYGTGIRGGYSIFGNMVFDDETGSNVGSIVFHGMVRSTGTGTESSQTGVILSSMGTGVNITAFLPRINTANDNLRVQFTNANATRAMTNCVLQMIVMGQAL